MVWNVLTQATRTRFSVATGPAVRWLTFWSKTLEKIWPSFSAIIFFQGGRQRWCWQRYEDLQGLVRGSREAQRHLMSRTWDLNIVILIERADSTPAPLQFKFILSEHTSRISGLLWRYPSNLYSLCHKDKTRWWPMVKTLTPLSRRLSDRFTGNWSWPA